MVVAEAVTVEAKKVEKKVAEEEPPMRVWCEQCERNQSPELAKICDSPFCKAKAKLGI